jgi:hypothetical protein
VRNSRATFFEQQRLYQKMETYLNTRNFNLLPIERCATEYSECNEDALLLKNPCEQSQWFSDITGLTEEEFRDQIDV